MVSIYSDYTRARIGWFFGLSGPQLGVVAAASLPLFWAVHQGAWVSAAMFAACWAVVLAITVAPVRGRSVTGWIAALLSYTLGGLLGWTRFRAKASTGQAEVLTEPDLPGALAGVQVHDGPPQGAMGRRVAIIQDHRAKTWAVTAALVHPGIGMMEADDRERQGKGLSDLLDTASRTEIIDEILFVQRTVSEDGAERGLWLNRHRRPDGPAVARAINDDLGQRLSQACVRTETFVTFVVPEARIGKEAKEGGGGLEGRARVLYGAMREMDALLRAGMGMTGVDWLTSPELALAARTGFAPGDRAGIIDALAERAHDSGVNADVPWAMAGPSGADPAARHYSHDAWNSISATITLPAKGAAMGALRPVLTPGAPGERRSFMVAYPIMGQSAAGRQSATSEWSADLGQELRSKAQIKQRTKGRDDAERIRGLDRKLARGNCLTQPYAVCTVTVPKTARVAEFGRRLDAAVRRAGFAPLRLDLSQDTAFAASTIPLGISLTRKGDA